MRQMLALATPVALMYLGLMLMGFVDLLVVGRLGAAPMGAVGISTSLFSWVMVVGIGMLQGMDYPASHAMGAGRPDRTFKTFVQASHLAWMLSIPMIALLILLANRLEVFGFNAEIIPGAKRYLALVAWSLYPVLAFNACRGYLQAKGIALPQMWTLIIGNGVNLVLNIGLVFGKFGLPEMGLQGSAWATLISRVFLLVMIVAFIVVDDRRTGRVASQVSWKIDGEYLFPILRLGWPSSFQMLLEVGVFSLSTAIAAKLTATALAAHQLVLNTASLSFMVPLGIGSAASVLVGRAMGSRDFALARKMGTHALVLGVGFMTFTALAFLLFPGPILGVYTHDLAVIAVARELILVAGLFQIFDGAQVALTGILRGIADTRSAAIANFVGHWAIGLPLGVYLCFMRDQGVLGIWIGLSTGLAFVAFALLWVWKSRSRIDQLAARADELRPADLRSHL